MDATAPADPRLLWPSAGLALLAEDAQGALQATPAWWRHWLTRPELQLVAESCAGERRLHQRLEADPLAAVGDAELAAVADEDVRQSWRHWLSLRQGVQARGSLAAWLLAQFQGGVQAPPLFLDLVTQALVQQALCADPALGAQALAWRAGELFFRPQQVHLEQGRLLAADRLTVDDVAPSQGLGSLGLLLAQAQLQPRALELQVLQPDTAPRYFAEAARPTFSSRTVLDLTPTWQQDLGHGLHFTLNNAASGLVPLARLLEHWVRRMLGVRVRIEPVARVDDPRWRWHLGLDAESSALLNDLYQAADIPPERMARLVSLFTLHFEDPADMRADVAGCTVYLGLAFNAQGLLRMKPQNLLLNLPLARRS